MNRKLSNNFTKRELFKDINYSDVNATEETVLSQPDLFQPKERASFVRTYNRTVFAPDGTKHTVVLGNRHAGKPVFKFIESEPFDSAYNYPVLERNIFIMGNRAAFDNQISQVEAVAVKAERLKKDNKAKRV